MRVFHIAERDAWERARQGGRYEAPSLASEGFIHCSLAEQVLPVAALFYAGRAGLVLLEIAVERLSAELRFDPVAGPVGPDRFPHLYGPLDCDAVVRAHDFAADMESGIFRLPPDLAADLPPGERVLALMGLSPLPGEGGHYRETYRSPHGTAIYYLLQSDTFSALHRLDGDEVYHFYAGAPVELTLLQPGGRVSTIVLGADLAAGHRPQFVVPAGVWQGSRLAAPQQTGQWALLGTTMAPPFSPDRFEPGARDALLAAYPSARERILALTR